MRDDVVALYVDPRGPYPTLVREWYDEARDARTYAGSLPVVAHPPCGPWSSNRHLYRGSGRELAAHALSEVRRCGGVLEHPATSTFWAHAGLPMPGEEPDQWGGYSVEVEQVRWGHVARKRTLLYVVGGRCGPIPPPRDPTHWVSGRRGMARACDNVPPGIKVCSAQQRRRTPIAFAEWLIELASTARCHDA